MAQVLPASGASHDDMIHDAVLDYYGRRLATCSSDRTIKIFEVDGTDNSQRLVDTLRGHDGAVWAVSWAHPKYGNILASCAYDGKVLIWREGSGSPQQAGAWTRIADFALHGASVNAIAWAPHEVGALLACASSDGAVSVIEFRDSPAAAPAGNGNWAHTVFPAHQTGVYGVSWAPSFAPGALEKASGPAPQQLLRRFVTGGSDSTVAVWEYSQASQGYENLVRLTGHTDWVRDVAWSPTVLAKSYIASASQDKTVRIWTLAAGQDPSSAANWKCNVLQFETVIWRVSWSLTGNVLAISGGDNKVSLWKERLRDGGWECVKTVEE